MGNLDKEMVLPSRSEIKETQDPFLHIDRQGRVRSGQKAEAANRRIKAGKDDVEKAILEKKLLDDEYQAKLDHQRLLENEKTRKNREKRLKRKKTDLAENVKKVKKDSEKDVTGVIEEKNEDEIQLDD